MYHRDYLLGTFSTYFSHSIFKRLLRVFVEPFWKLNLTLLNKTINSPEARVGHFAHVKPLPVADGRGFAANDLGNNHVNLHFTMDAYPRVLYKKQ